MFKKILVALDRSSEASTVFDFALSVAQPEISDILLVHFIDWQMHDISPWIGFSTLYDVDISSDPDNWSRESLEKEIEQSKTWLETYAQKAIARNIACTSECRVS